jgi:hypothetical protein
VNNKAKQNNGNALHLVGRFNVRHSLYLFTNLNQIFSESVISDFLQPCDLNLAETRIYGYPDMVVTGLNNKAKQNNGNTLHLVGCFDVRHSLYLFTNLVFSDFCNHVT